MQFKTHAVVRSRVDAQGLAKGRCYCVKSSRTRHTPFGGFTTYDLVDEDDVLVEGVGNGHLLLELVFDADDDGLADED